MCNTGTLTKKINELETKGLITSDEKVLFHKVRDYGNKSAHLGEAMTSQQIASGLNISVHLLEKLFVEPEKKKKILKEAKSSLGKK
jgi:hypothetical protein